MGVDATVVSPLHADGRPWPRAATSDGVAIRRAELAKRRTYPELVDSSEVRLITLACEVGGRWSSTVADVLRRMGASRARSAPQAIQASARGAWARRWGGLLSVGVQSALAATLVDDVPLELDGIDELAPPDVEVWADAA